MSLILKPFTLSDSYQLSQWVKNEKELIQFAGDVFSFPLTKNQIVTYLDDDNRVVYKVLVNNEVVGHAELYFIQPDEIKLCRILIGNPSYRSKGLGTRLIKKLLGVAFENYNVKKVSLNVFDWNLAAIKCYEKVGLKNNQNKFKTITVDDETWMAINMSINKEDWTS